jgi:PAS domain S-box-containing protein
MLSYFFQLKNIENYSFDEQKRITLTTRIAFAGTILLLFYVPIITILKNWDFLSIILFTTLIFISVLILNRSGKHFLAKLLLCIEPIIHILFVELREGNSVHLYNFAISSIPFLIFSFNTHRIYIIITSLLNIFCVAICQLVVFYPEFNPFIKQSPIWWFEYINWVTGFFMCLVMSAIFRYTSDEYEKKLMETITESDKLLKDLEEAAREAMLSEIKSEKLNQELISREEELRQNLEELQATQEALLKEKLYAEQMKERFQGAIEGTNDGIWDWDLKTNYVFYSPKWKSMLGYTEEDLKNELNTFSELTHPDHIQRVFAEVQAYMEGKISKYEVEIPMKTKEGNYRWILSKGTVLRDEKGMPYRMLGSHTDITERKEQQEKLEKLNRELIAREIELKKNLEENTYTQEQLIMQSQALMAVRKKLETQNQELVTREEELKQNLEELHTTQEALLKEKESTSYKSTLFQIVAKANETLLSEKNWQYVIETTLSSIGKVLTVDRGYFFERDETSNKEIITVSQKMEWARSGEFAVIDDPQMHNLPIGLFQEFYSVLSKNQIFQAIVQNMPHSELKQILLSQDIKSLIVAPIFIENEFYGFIGWDDCTQERVFSPDELNAVYSLAYSLSSALQNIRNEQQIQQKNQELIAREEELKQNLEELHATQEQMRLAQAEAERNAMNANKIFEAAPVGLFISKVSNRTIVQANQAMAKLLNLPVYEIIGRSTPSFYASETQAETIFAELRKGQFNDKEIDLKLDDGSVITTLASAQVMTLNNEKMVVAGLNDITELKKAQAELADLAANLAKRVEEQTQEVKRSFAQMVQNEKMAALGQLVAGVAHEINTPIGAIKASAENMQENLPRLIEETFSNPVPDTLIPVFDKAVKSMLNERVSLTSREERTYRKQITELLEEHGIENASDIAFNLVQVGLVKNTEEFIPIFKQESYESILALISRIGRLKVNIDTILLATNKTKKIVSALKSYVHRQAEDALVPTNINESIETVLVLYHNQTKHGVEVITEFEEIPQINTYADELSQVWTNIIVNGLQAMQYKGCLRIKTEQQNGHILVSITDNGPGIPKEIQDKIFEPFFTTKSQGEGTGLGLDICKKIIEKHNGTMYFTSEPGNTTFYISLPIHQPEYANT